MDLFRQIVDLQNTNNFITVDNMKYYIGYSIVVSYYFYCLIKKCISTRHKIRSIYIGHGAYIQLYKLWYKYNC